MVVPTAALIAPCAVAVPARRPHSAVRQWLLRCLLLRESSAAGSETKGGSGSPDGRPPRRSAARGAAHRQVRDKVPQANYMHDMQRNAIRLCLTDTLIADAYASIKKLYNRCAARANGCCCFYTYDKNACPL